MARTQAPRACATRRKAFLMEIGPVYCDVIVQRWEKVTGRKAERFAARAEKSAPAEAGAWEGK